ncbi:MAG: hypothetical protein ABEK03_10455 [Candidatus Bipolaricaulia bacterium]
MTKLERSSLLVLTLAVLFAALAATPAYGQSPLEQWAENKISDRTGIPPEPLATLFVDTSDNQFILSFVFINEEVMQSDLRDGLKESIRPYVGQRAMMAMIVPTQESTFQPNAISFVQSERDYLLSSSSIKPITDGFRAGPVPSQEVNAGVLMLPDGLNLDRPFTIQYQDDFSTSFSLQPPSDGGRQGSPSVDKSQIQNFLLFLLQTILAFILFPFLI